MTRNGAAQVGATRPFAGGARSIAALISGTLLLLTMVAGVGGVGGLTVLGKTAATTVSTVAAASTAAVPVAGDRRAAPALGSPAGQRHTAGWAPHHPEAADIPAVSWQPPAGLVDPQTEAEPAVIALTIQLSHRGRAPPAGSPVT